MEQNKIIKDIKEIMKEQPEMFPFISANWDIEVLPKTQNKEAKFSKHNSLTRLPKSFYKPISKIIDIEKIEKNER